MNVLVLLMVLRTETIVFASIEVTYECYTSPSIVFFFVNGIACKQVMLHFPEMRFV